MALAAALAAGAYLGAWQWRVHHRAAEPRATPSPPATALAGATAAPPATSTAQAPAPTPAGLAGALRGPLADPRLGGRTLTEVRDATTGRALVDQGGTTPAAPASTAKIATAIAVLAVRRAGDRITTRVMAGDRPGTVVLVGGGDPTLTGAAVGTSGAYPDAARVSDLAHQLRNTPVNRIVVDGSLFSGPATSPYWVPDDVPSSYAAPITAITVDGGRAAPGDTVRSTAPNLAAGQALADALGRDGITVTSGRAPSGARVVAGVESAPIGTLVTQMLQQSDNVIAESLARQVALADGQPASFAGAQIAVRQALRRLGVDIGAGLVDGSGLAARDRLTPDVLSRLLSLVAGSAHPDLHLVADALPVAGWDGTLAGRYTSPGSRSGAGVVRAKTGTLTSVSTLAGLVHDADGRLLVFALMADQVGPSAADTDAAEAALDRVAATLAGCGCR